MKEKRSEFRQKESSSQLEATVCDLGQPNTLSQACLRKLDQNPIPPKCETAHTFQDKACQQGRLEQTVLLGPLGKKSQCRLKD